MRIFCLLLLAFLLKGGAILAQQTSLKGRVTTQDGKPLLGATLVVIGSSIGTQTDLDGYYILNKLPQETITVTVSYVGFKSQEKSITLQQNNNSLFFTLVERANALANVTVNGKSKKTALETKGFTVAAIQTEEASIRNLQTNELLNTTVGVKIRQNGGLGASTQYSLNGLAGDAVRIFIDGIPISVYGNSFNLNSIPPAMIKEIQVYKGVVPGHLADDALGGAINIELHSHAQNTLNAAISYGSFNTIQTNANAVYRMDTSGFTVKASLFQNYSDNDYEVSGRSVVVTGLGGVQTPITARRFNDAYRSTGGVAQIGFTDVSWADQFFVGVTASDDYKEVQHGAFMTLTPYKDRFLESDALLGSVTYQKKNFLTKGLAVNFTGLYGNRNRAVVDTLAQAYSWAGIPAVDFRGNQYEYAWGSQQEESGPTLAKIKRKVASVRSGISYAFNSNHKVLFNHVFSKIDREDSDALAAVLENTFIGTRDLDKHIYSLTYDFSAFQKKLKMNVFGKHYYQKTISVDPAIESDIDGTNRIVDEVVASKVNYNGYGFASSYAFIPELTLMASAEKAIRLPNETEIFGNDGDNVVANSSINPEQSNNYNLGLRLGAFTLKKHQFTLYSNLFLRSIKDRIGLPIENSLNINDEVIFYVNQGSGESKGVDAQLTYTHNNNLALNFNISKFDLTIENRGTEIAVPNTPFLTMNGSLRYGMDHIFQKNSHLNFFYNLYYTDDFSYLVPQGSNTVGDDFFKIPEQLVQDIGFSYSFPNKKVILSLDVKNIFNKPVFDNLSVQKPGRAIYLKLNYSIKNF